MLTDAKTKTIEYLIEKTINGEKIKNEKEIKYLSYFDIASYAKLRKLKYSLQDIGRNQKADLIKSIVKHNKVNK